MRRKSMRSTPSTEGTYNEQFDERFQVHILAVAARVQGFVQRFRTALDPAFFAVETHRNVAMALFEHVDNYGNLPTRETLTEHVRELVDEDKMRSVGAFLDELFQIPTHDSEAVADKAVEFGQTQAMCNAVLKAAEDLAQGNRQRVLGLVQGAQLVGQDLLNVGIDYKDSLDERHNWYLNPKSFRDPIPTGISHLDAALEGGLGRGELGVLMSPPRRGKCVAPYTRIWTPAYGYMSMAEVVKQRPDLFGVDLAARTSRVASVIAVSEDDPKPIAEIALRSGRVLRGFANTHPVLTWDGWTPTEDLRVGDFVVGSKVLPLSGRCSSYTQPNRAYVIGVFIGDGGLTDTQPMLHIHCDDDLEVVENVRCIVGPEFIGRVRNYKGKAGVIGCSRRLWSWLGCLKGLKSRDKYIPADIFGGGTSCVAACVAGLFDTDGSVLKDGSLEWTIASHRLSEDLLTALNCLGIYATRRVKIVKLLGRKYTAYRVGTRDIGSLRRFRDACSAWGAHAKKWARVAQLVGSRSEHGNPYERLPYYAWECVRKLAVKSRWEGTGLAGAWRSLGFAGDSGKASWHVNRAVRRQSRMSLAWAKKWAAYTGDPALQLWASGDFVFDEVVSIKWGAPEPTLDVSVDAHVQSFFAEHVFTHNTTALINFGYGALVSPLVYGGFKVVHYSLELRDRMVIRRYDDRLAGNLIKSRLLNPDEYLEILARNMRRYVWGRMFVQSYPTRSAGVSTVRAHLKLLASRGFCPDLLIVDYADIMKAERRLGEVRHEVASVYEDLRALADELNCAVWTASQSGADSWDRETLHLRDFAEAREKAHIADVVVGFAQTDDEFVAGTCRLQLLKFRVEEDLRTVLCDIDRRRCRLRSRLLLDAAKKPIEVEGRDILDQRTTAAMRQIEALDAQRSERERSPQVRRQFQGPRRRLDG